MTGRIFEILQIAAFLLLPLVERCPTLFSTQVHAQDAETATSDEPASADTAELVEPLLQVRPELRDVVDQPGALVATTGLSNDVRTSLSDTRAALFETRIALADLRGQMGPVKGLASRPSHAVTVATADRPIETPNEDPSGARPSAPVRIYGPEP